MFCGNCGKEVADGRNFCPGCGAPIYPNLSVPERNRAQNNRQMVLVIALIASVLVVAAIGIVGWFSYRNYVYSEQMAAGLEFAQEGKYEEAVECYSRALEEKANSAEAAIALADSCLRAGNVQEAATLLSGLSINESEEEYEAYQKLLLLTQFDPQIVEINTENFPLITVIISGNAQLSDAMQSVAVLDNGIERALTGCDMDDGRLKISYESDEAENQSENREVMVTLETEGISVQKTGQYQTPSFLDAAVTLVTTDVSEYPLVKVYFRVSDENGDSVMDLDANAFKISEQAYGGEYLSREVHSAVMLKDNLGLNIDLVADKSDSIAESDMDKIKEVMTEFVNNLQYEVGDKAEVLAFDSIVQQMCYFTDDSSLLVNGIHNMSTDGRTAFYDAVYDSIRYAALQGGARCVIAFTDGRDNMSVHTAAEVVEYANANQVPVYIIGVGDKVEESTLRTMAVSANGYYWFIDDLYDLEEIFDQVYREQKELYAVEYFSDESLDQYLERTLEVTVTGGGYRATDTVSFQPVSSVQRDGSTSRYQLFKESLSWEEASLRCQEMGGHLATITSQEEMDQITAMADAEDVRYVWLGGYTSYDSHGNVFGHWVTGEEFSFQAWCEEEPSRVDLDGTAEWYIMLWNVESKGGWSWNDQRNDPAGAVASMTEYMGYVCEFED